VTVLTSVDRSDLEKDGVRGIAVGDLVALRVRNAVSAGVDGIVCSPLEVTAVRAAAGPETILVTPGVRPAGAAVGDQKRVATPAEAMANGANYLVIGRPITRAIDPRAAMEGILAELGQRSR
jgi:orotidine-5'-phosphate decarboxylase